MQDKDIHLHLVSDSTGETLSAIARACLAQFEHVNIHEHSWSLIRSPRQLKMVLEGIRQWPGLVLFTFVDEGLSESLQTFCLERGIEALSVLAPVIECMARSFHQASLHKPGRQHTLDTNYFNRIDAMDFALAFDDGHKADHVADADVLILGVSRTSKTPTCIYLAHRGIRAANIPLIPGMDLPVDIAALTKPLVVGLTKDPHNLVDIRRARLKGQNQVEETSYTDIEMVQAEIREARKLFAKLNCPVIDVTRRSIEETAAEIITLLNQRNLDKAKHEGVF